MKRFTQIVLMTVVVALVIPAMGYAAGKEAFVDAKWNDSGFSFSGKLDGKSASLSTGEFNLKLRDASGNLVKGGEIFTGFCVDPWQGSKANVLVDFVKPSDYVVRNENAGLQAAWLFDTYFKEENATKSEIAGLQLALWEIVVDSNSSIDLTQGNFIITGCNDAIKNAKTYLASMPKSFSATMVARLNSSYVIGKTGNAQDFIVKIGDPVPEPATMLLLGLGLLGIAGIARKKRNR